MYAKTYCNTTSLFIRCHNKDKTVCTSTTHTNLRDGSQIQLPSLEEESITQIYRSLRASLHLHLTLIVIM